MIWEIPCEGLYKLKGALFLPEGTPTSDVLPGVAHPRAPWDCLSYRSQWNWPFPARATEWGKTWFPRGCPFYVCTSYMSSVPHWGGVRLSLERRSTVVSQVFPVTLFPPDWSSLGRNSGLLKGWGRSTEREKVILEIPSANNGNSTVSFLLWLCAEPAGTSSQEPTAQFSEMLRIGCYIQPLQTNYVNSLLNKLNSKTK